MDRDQQASNSYSFTAPAGLPLFGVLTEENGRQVVRYFAGDSDPATLPGAEAKLQAALAVVGAWSDLDWDEFAEELDRIRHDSPPTPPIDL